MSKSTVGVLVVGVGVLWLSSWAMADAAGDYQALFGQEEKAAARSAKGSVEFAAKLLNATKSVAAQKDLQALLCEKAYEFAMKAPAGNPTAAEAMKLLMEVSPDKRATARDRLVEVMQRQFASSRKEDRSRLGQELVDLLVAAGDEQAEADQPAEAMALYRRALSMATARRSGRTREIMDKIRGLSAAQESERRIAALKARLDKAPGNVAVRTALILAYLGAGDDPEEAAKLLTPEVGEDLRTLVPLAARKVEDLGESVCLQLAEWYAALAEKASPADKGMLLGRALACCERYVAVHTTQDVSALKAKMLLDKVTKGAAQAGGKGPKLLSLELAKGVPMKLVLIPAGRFLMGSPDTEKGRPKNETPQHEVIITRPFYMGQFLVTQPQYEAIMGNNPSSFKGPNNPVEGVGWKNAAEFCKKLSGKTKRTVRLPTEAEWEYACRAGTTTPWFFGDDGNKLGDYAWFGGNASEMAHPVGLKQPNPFGLYDMYGNVYQWCSDFYLDDFYAKSRKVDPQGPETTAGAHILRGGTWWTGADRSRSAFRSWTLAGYRYGDHGFRVVMQVDR